MEAELIDVDVTHSRPSGRGMAVTALVFALVGASVAIFGFVSGIDYALNGSGAGPGSSIIVFFVGAALLLVGVVLAIVSLLRSTARVVPTIALVVGLLPIAGLIVAALANRH